jgi:transcriptional regulator with XRE-family HTH domain
MNEQDTRPAGTAATNPEVGKLVGLSYSGVSRIRSGDRYPSLQVMRKIAAAYSWPVSEQLDLIPDNKKPGTAYALEFERRIAARK